MSAYALPGSIFPPMSGYGFESSYVMASSTGGSSSLSFEQQSRPQHDQNPSFSSPFHFKPVDFSSIRSSPIAANSPLTPAAPPHGEESEDTSGTSQVGISVKDAKIDPVRLVKSLTTTTKSRKQNNSATPSAPQEVTANKSGSCKVDKNTCSNDEDDDPHKDAIQFELNISFNGRTYSATRTMPRIIQLRNDLISEINIRRSKALRRMRWIKKQSKVVVDFLEVDEADDIGDDMTVKTVDDNDNVSRHDHYDDVKIPELPDYYSAEERSNSGGRGRGFTLLHALLRSYCPVMEGWLLKVTALVPDSPSLSNFLWEPVSGSADMRSTNSFSTLVSIKEDDSEDEVEDEEDDFFAF
jgi:hypothetical protein